MKEKPLEEVIDEMRAIGEHLIPYSYPLKPSSDDEQLIVLKQRTTVVDGYEIGLLYSKSDYETHFIEALQVWGHNFSFLPFCLVCKLGKRFLGGHELSLVEIPKDNRKIYCWSVNVDRTGRPIPCPYEVDCEFCEYEGFQYFYLQPNQVNFF